MFQIIFQRPNIPSGVILIAIGFLIAVSTSLTLWAAAFIIFGAGLLLISVRYIGLALLGVGGLLFLIALLTQSNKLQEWLEPTVQIIGFQ